MTFSLTAFLEEAGVGRKVVHLQPKEDFFSQGDSADSIFYLRSGRAKLTVLSPEGKEATVAFLSSGDFIGEESLASVGSIMGSGGMIVMDETSCMVDVAKFFMDFCTSESCGKCVPCRVGTAHMLDLLEKIASGSARQEDLELLERIADTVKSASLCGLGQTAPNPVFSTLRYFRDEYTNHIENKACEAGVCVVARKTAGVSA